MEIMFGDQVQHRVEDDSQADSENYDQDECVEYMAMFMIVTRMVRMGLRMMMGSMVRMEVSHHLVHTQYSKLKYFKVNKILISKYTK